jgi:hypothetical protein
MNTVTCTTFSLVSWLLVVGSFFEEQNCNAAKKSSEAFQHLRSLKICRPIICYKKKQNKMPIQEANSLLLIEVIAYGRLDILKNVSEQ